MNGNLIKTKNMIKEQKIEITLNDCEVTFEGIYQNVKKEISTKDFIEIEDENGDFILINVNHIIKVVARNE